MKSLNWIADLKSLSLMSLAALLFVSGTAQAAPGTIWFQDNFERSNPGSVGNGWVITPVANVGGGAIDCTGAAGNTGCAGIDSDVPPWNVVTSPRANLTKSMFTRWNGVYVTSPVINLSTAPAAQLTYWLRRGSDCFSEWPGNQPTGCTYTSTITVTGTTSTSVSGITINGVQIMSGASTAAAAQNTVAANIAAKINVAGSGFTASVNNNVVTITGANMNAYSTLPIITQVGTMTLTTAFSPSYVPNYGEEFEVQYLNSASIWVGLDKYPAEGPPGEQFRPVIQLPSDALWSGFKIRFYQPSGSGSNGTGGGATNVRGYDYWHMDDVVVTELATTNYTGSFCDNFEGSLSRWTVLGYGDASIGSKYFQGGAHDLDIRWDAVTVTSKPTNITNVTGNLSFWVKRGIGTATIPNLTGSDFPEAGKNLVVQYLTNAAPPTWVTLTTFLGGGTAGQVYCPTVGVNCPVATPATNSFPIPANANLAAFQMRFSFTGTGTGFDFDYWHVDDVCIGAVAQPTDLSMTISPASTTLVPGAMSTITMTISNSAAGNIEPGVITVTDTLPAGLVLNGSTVSSWSNGTLLPGATNACTAVGQIVTCTRVGSLAAGASTVLYLQVQATPSAAGSGLLNTATAAGQASDTNLANNTATNLYSFVPAAFEAYETFTTPATATAGRIFAKLVGTSFNLDVLAVNAGFISTGYNRTATVDLIDGTLACVVGTAALTGVTVTPASYTYTTGTGNDNGVHIFAFTSTAAYPNVKVRVRDNNNAIGCSSDNFSIRPSAFTVTSSNANNSAATGAPAIKTGGAFALTATAASGYNSATPPVIDTTQVIGSPNKGTLTGAFGTVAGGVATGAGFTYSEVGNFGLAANAVYDSTFTAVDQPNDCVGSSSSNVLTNGQYGCNIGNTAIPLSSGFGRFIPDHFDTAIVAVAGVPLVCPSGLTPSCPSNASGASGMVYSGQSFTVQVTAKNSNSAITANYQSPYATAVSLSAWSAAGSSTAPASGTLSSVPIAANAFAAGVGSTVTLPTYILPIYTGIPTVAPTDFFMRAVDADNVSSLWAGSLESGLKAAYGQIKVPNVYGSELLPLSLTMMSQYYSAIGWVKSVTDSVTSLTLATSYPVGTGTTAPTPTGGTMSGGQLTIKLSKPGVKGVATINPTAPSYLPVNSGTATFGVYKGTNEFIYQREAY